MTLTSPAPPRRGARLQPPITQFIFPANQNTTNTASSQLGGFSSGLQEKSATESVAPDAAPSGDVSDSSQVTAAELQHAGTGEPGGGDHAGAGPAPPQLAGFQVSR